MVDFFSALVGIFEPLAWPAVAVVVAILFRSEIKNLLARLNRSTSATREGGTENGHEMARIGFRVPEGFTAPDQNFYPKLSANEFIERFQKQLASGEPIQLGYLKNVFISVEKKDDVIVMVLLSGVSKQAKHSQGMAFALRPDLAVGLITRLVESLYLLKGVDARSIGKPATVTIDFKDDLIRLGFPPETESP